MLLATILKYYMALKILSTILTLIVVFLGAATQTNLHR